MAVFMIPCWQGKGTVTVEASSLDEAVKLAKSIDWDNLPDNIFVKQSPDISIAFTPVNTCNSGEPVG